MTGDHLGALWKYRQLVWTIAWGDFKWRYKNSILGYFWSLLEPLIMFIILYIVFSNLMRVQVEYYQLFLLLGIIMWNFFTKATNLGLNAIVGKPSLIQRVYFPRDVPGSRCRCRSHPAARDYASRSMRSGASSRSFTATRNDTASRPSTTR